MRFLNFMNTPTGRVIRIGGGVVVLAVGLLLGGWLGTALAVFSVLPIATGVFGVCPINPLFGRSARACSVPAATRLSLDGSYDGAMAVGFRHVGVIGAMAEEVERLHEHLDAETVSEQANRVYRHGCSLGSESPSSSPASARLPQR